MDKGGAEITGDLDGLAAQLFTVQPPPRTHESQGVISGGGQVPCGLKGYSEDLTLHGGEEGLWWA